MMFDDACACYHRECPHCRVRTNEGGREYASALMNPRPFADPYAGLELCSGRSERDLAGKAVQSETTQISRALEAVDVPVHLELVASHPKILEFVTKQERSIVPA